jgi:two-component system, NtrC family, sensor histidine kinase HydH
MSAKSRVPGLAAIGPNAAPNGFSGALRPFDYHRVRRAVPNPQNRNPALENPTLAFDNLQREFKQQVRGLLLRLRFVIAPLPLLLGLFVLVLDDAPWRKFAIGLVLLFAAILLGGYGVRRHHPERLNLQRLLLLIAMVPHPIILIATGGVFSPVLIAMLLVCFVASTMLERRASLSLMSFQVGTIIVAAVLEYTQILGPLIPSPFNPHRVSAHHSAWPFVFAAVSCLFFFVSSEMGYRIQQVFVSLLRNEVRARDESLQLHREQLAELTVLSGEIAHELKNPLASIKGLAALLAQRSHGREAEQLAVLRREADRMQGILDEFLNFSRPLLPLNLAMADLSLIVSDVCALHAGIAESQGIQLVLETPDQAEVLCDARKVRQILVNLIQNAFEASPANSRIRIAVALADCVVEVVLDDQGTGMDPKVADRVFEAGVTSKAGGSGLGLSVARGLARQHGGDVTLVARGTGGCRATLRLPSRPPLPCPDIEVSTKDTKAKPT